VRWLGRPGRGWGCRGDVRDAEDAGDDELTFSIGGVERPAAGFEYEMRARIIYGSAGLKNRYSHPSVGAIGAAEKKRKKARKAGERGGERRVGGGGGGGGGGEEAREQDIGHWNW